MPPVYRRDRGVAFSGKATAFAILHEPDEAATAAIEALGIARNAGSERIVRMVIHVAEGVSQYRRSLSSAARLHALLAGQDS